MPRRPGRHAPVYVGAINRVDSRRRSEADRKLEAMFELVAELLAGKNLAGRYRLEHLVRTDALGALYEGVDPEQREPVLVRIVRSLRDDVPEAAIPTARIPHAAEILDVGRTGPGLGYIVMEALSGETVADRLSRGKPICLAEAIDWGLVVATALAAAHRAENAHGCVAPASVFLHRADTPAQTVKLINFGIVRFLPVETLSATAPARELGPYLAPEVLSAGVPSSASDVYSLAALLGTLCRGQLPPVGCTQPQLAEWAAVAVPSRLRRLVERGLSVRPSPRPRVDDIVASIEGMKTGAV